MATPPIVLPLPKAMQEPARVPGDQTMFLDAASALFDAGVTDLQANLRAAQVDLVNDPSNPSVLAKYQSLLSEYTLYRNAQSNVVKTYKDVDSAIIQNFR